MKNVHDITKEFEKVICEYTSAPYCVAVDNCSNALFLSLVWWGKQSGTNFISIPSRTYPAVPCEIIHAGFKVSFEPMPDMMLKGAYQLKPTSVWDSALTFTKGMYITGQIQCLSFTGPHKHLKLGKGGAILTDNEEAYNWFKRARFSGRRECSYHEDNFDMIGWNFYMMPEIAARGLLLMSGMPEHNEDLSLPYPDLSKFPVYARK